MLSRLSLIPRNSLRLLSTTSKLFDHKEFTNSEEWLYHTSDYIKVGITKNAVEQLGEIVFIDYLYEKNDVLEENEELLLIESVKAVENISLDFKCEILENNLIHLDDLEILNENPECEEKGWIVKVKKIE